MSNYTGRGNTGSGNRTSSTQGGYKSNNTAKAAPVAAATGTDEVQQKPALSLSMSIDGNDKLVPITGVFANTSKNGKAYYSVKVKEEIVIPAGAKLMVFANDQK